MIAATKRLSRELGRPLDIRIGINTGPVVAGIIGRKKFIYDIWGDAVNVASRMESNGDSGSIQATAAMKSALDGKYICAPRGRIDIKGKGSVETWWLLGRASAAVATGYPALAG